MAALLIGPSTELDAINTMLASIGESPVVSLDNDVLTTDVSVAVQTLQEISRSVQLEGWVCNTEKDYPLPPSDTGEIMLPHGTLRVSFFDPSGEYVAVRGNRLYDLVGHTYVFSRELSATIIFHLPFDLLTECLRRYITVKALRVFQDRVIGSTQLHSYQERDEYVARAAAFQENSDMGRFNIQKGTSGFLGGWDVAAVLQR